MRSRETECLTRPNCVQKSSRRLGDFAQFDVANTVFHMHGNLRQRGTRWKFFAAFIKCRGNAVCDQVPHLTLGGPEAGRRGAMAAFEASACCSGPLPTCDGGCFPDIRTSAAATRKLLAKVQSDLQNAMALPSEGQIKSRR
jgi:hypothetical protein